MAERFRRIEPMVFPNHRSRVPGEQGFRLDWKDSFVFDVFAKETVTIGGTQCEIFQLNKQTSTVDPLYSEPSVRVFDGPYQIFAQVDWPEPSPEALEEGMHEVWPSGAWIPRKIIEEAKARAPTEGDVIHFWSLPFYDAFSVRNLPNVPEAGYYFEIMKVADEGHVNDSAAFVAFKCDIKRRSEFTAERLITGA